jgi:site-specific recombinase XerD
VHRFCEFAKSRQYLKNVSRKTLDWYECSFAAFQRFHPEPDYTKESLRAFVIRLRDSGVSSISANTYCRAVTAYLRWLHEEGFAHTILRIPPLKTEKKVLATFSPTDVRKLLAFRPRLKYGSPH